MIGNRELSGLGVLVAGSALYFMVAVGAQPAFADPPECPAVNDEEGSGYAATFNTIWKVSRIDLPLGESANRKHHLCEGDRFVFIRSGGPDTEKEFLIPVGNLAARWGSGQLQVKRTPPVGPTGGNRLCVEVSLRGHGSGEDSLHVFKFRRTIAWGPDVDRIEMEIEFDQRKDTFKCESESRDTHHGMAHAHD